MRGTGGQEGGNERAGAVGGDPLLETVDLRVTSRMGDRSRTITSGTDLRLMAGETLGIVGESGSGKSITARAILGILPAGVTASGQVRYRGRDLLGLSQRELAVVRGREISMVFQDPFTMLNPLMRCGEQIAELLRDAAGRRLSRRARRAEAVARLREVGITDPGVADAYPFQLSGGMRQRVGIAAAVAQDPDLLIADEPSTALDVRTQREVLARLREVQESRGMGLILITHDLRVAFSICDRIAVLYAGSVLETGPSAQIAAQQRHPYTQGLLLSEPPRDRRLARLTAIAGSVPSADEAAGRCAFADRCAWAAEACLTAAPVLAPAGEGRQSACVRWVDIASQMRVVGERAAEGVTVPADEPSSPLVVVDRVSKSFSRNDRVVHALQDVSLVIGPGESVGIVGESGSGKTTLGRCLLGLERPASGTITIDGVDATDYDRVSRGERRHLRRTVQMIFQDPYSTLNPARTVGATLSEALHVAASDRQQGAKVQTVDELLEIVGLSADYASRKPVALSGGERQRVGIARALAARPRLVVCDEAVSALDVSVQAQILNLLGSIRDELGIGYLFITHDLAVVRQVTDRTYVLNEGQVVESGPTERVLDQPVHAYTRSLIDATPRMDRTWLGSGSST